MNNTQVVRDLSEKLAMDVKRAAERTVNLIPLDPPSVVMITTRGMFPLLMLAATMVNSRTPDVVSELIDSDKSGTPEGEDVLLSLGTDSDAVLWTAIYLAASNSIFERGMGRKLTTIFDGPCQCPKCRAKRAAEKEARNAAS